MPNQSPPQKIPLVFFRTSSGGEPVREWLKGLDRTGHNDGGR